MLFVLLYYPVQHRDAGAAILPCEGLFEGDSLDLNRVSVAKIEVSSLPSLEFSKMEQYDWTVTVIPDIQDPAAHPPTTECRY